MSEKRSSERVGGPTVFSHMFGIKYKLKMHSKSACMMEMSFIPDQLFPMARCKLRPFLGVFCLRLWSKLVVGKGELSLVAAFRNALKKK